MIIMIITMVTLVLMTKLLGGQDLTIWHSPGESCEM